MGVLEAAEIGVPGVRMGVEMHHAERATFGDGAHDGQRDQVVAAGRQRHRAGGGLGEAVGRRVVHAAYLVIYCGRKRAWRAATNSSTAATKRSPSASPIMMFKATKPRRAIQMPAALMSRKNSSLASWLPA